MLFRIFLLFVLIFFPLSLSAEEDEPNVRFVSSLKHEMLYPLGLAFDFGKITPDNVYIGAEAGAGFAFGLIFHGYYAGGGLFLGRYFELGERKMFKLIPGGCLGWWKYIDDLNWQKDEIDDGKHYFGGPFVKILIGRRFNFNLSTKLISGFDKKTHKHYYDGSSYVKRTFSLYPSVEFGISWMY